ncbi:hypothetical protein THAOC_05894, partial [Thalassiosira oceanica]
AAESAREDTASFVGFRPAARGRAPPLGRKAECENGAARRAARRSMKAMPVIGCIDPFSSDSGLVVLLRAALHWLFRVSRLRRLRRPPFSGPWGPLPAGGLGLSKTLQFFAANHGQTYRGRALLVEYFQRAETAKPVPPV